MTRDELIKRISDIHTEYEEQGINNFIKILKKEWDLLSNN